MASAINVYCARSEGTGVFGSGLVWLMRQSNNGWNELQGEPATRRVCDVLACSVSRGDSTQGYALAASVSLRLTVAILVCAFPSSMMYRQAGEAEKHMDCSCVLLLYQEGIDAWVLWCV
jgi:hypothetical protein